jgi:hypothetical protein
MRCGGLHRNANPAFLGGFLCSGLLRVAPYCAPGGIRVVSGRGLALTLAALKWSRSVNGGVSSTSVESPITGMPPPCSMHLPIAPWKVSRTPSSTMGTKRNRCTAQAARRQPLWGRNRVGCCHNPSPPKAKWERVLTAWCLRREWLLWWIGTAALLRASVNRRVA